MKRTIMTLLAAATVAVGLAAPAQAVSQSYVPHGDHRAASTARIYDGYGRFGCSAVLIDPMWALTAAHCLPDNPHGTLGFGVDGQHARTPYSTAIHHPDRNVDIGLIKLDRPAHGVRVASYNLNPFHMNNGQTGHVYGWGGHANDRGQLGAAPVRVQNRMSSFHVVGTYAKLTTFGTTNGSHIVPGDSGGPVFMDQSNSTVSGISSYSNTTYPHLFLSTPTHIAGPWIAGTIAAGAAVGAAAHGALGSAAGVA